MVEQNHKEAEPDKLWGLVWEVKSIKGAHERLAKEGVEQLK